MWSRIFHVPVFALWGVLAILSWSAADDNAATLSAVRQSARAIPVVEDVGFYSAEAEAVLVRAGENCAGNLDTILTSPNGHPERPAVQAPDPRSR
jgi:hypothetical protein